MGPRNHRFLYERQPLRRFLSFRGDSPVQERACMRDRDAAYINPADCMDCGGCVAECPTNSIFAIDDLPADKIARWKRTRHSSPKHRDSNLTGAPS